MAQIWPSNVFESAVLLIQTLRFVALTHAHIGRLSDHIMTVYGVALEPPVAVLSHAMSAPAYSFHD